MGIFTENLGCRIRRLFSAGLLHAYAFPSKVGFVGIGPQQRHCCPAPILVHVFSHVPYTREKHTCCPRIVSSTSVLFYGCSRGCSATNSKVPTYAIGHRSCYQPANISVPTLVPVNTSSKCNQVYQCSAHIW